MSNILLESDFLSAVIAFAVVLIPAIIIHELGHFFAAKLVGINVLEFGIGFPPRAIRLFMWGETEFTLNWLPIGGFVRPLGEDMIGPVVEEDKAKHDDEEYISEREELLARGVPESKMLSVNEAKPLPRIFFMVAGALANFVSALFILVIVALIGIPMVVGARVQLSNIPAGSILDLEGVSEGDAVELINGQNFSTPFDLIQTLSNADTEQVILTMRNIEENSLYDVTISGDLTDSFFSSVVIDAVVEGSPADEAGLQPGDQIIGVNGRDLDPTVDPSDQIVAISNEFAGQALDLEILRDSETLTITLTPRSNASPSQGKIGIGIRSLYRLADNTEFYRASDLEDLVPQPLGVAIEYGFATTLGTIQAIMEIPGQIISGAISPEEARPVSVVGVSQIGGQLLQQSFEQGTPVIILNFGALMSIFLGFTNLLPLPPMDGGRILFVLIEMVRGRPVSPRIEILVYKIGIAFLLSLGLIIIVYDIFNPFVLPQ